ncbi:13891_t:CDS:2, partial [Funneliformis geosporum]
MTTIDIYDEVNRLSDIDVVEKLTEKEVADLFMYFNNTDKLPGVEKALIKSKNDKVKLTYLRNLLNSVPSIPKDITAE